MKKKLLFCTVIHHCELFYQLMRYSTNTSVLSWLFCKMCIFLLPVQKKKAFYRHN